MRSTLVRTVSAPVETVWAVLTDHEGMSNWAPGLKAKITKSGADERNGRGAVREIASPLPMPSIVEAIVEFDAPHTFAYRALAGVPLKNYRGDVELTPVDGGTRIRYSISAEQRVPLLERAATRAMAYTLLSALVRQVKKTG